MKLKFLQIYDYNGNRVERFPAFKCMLELIDNRLFVEHEDMLCSFNLDQFDYAIEKIDMTLKNRRRSKPLTRHQWQTDRLPRLRNLWLHTTVTTEQSDFVVELPF